MAPGLTTALEEGQEQDYLNIYVQNLSYLIQTRITLYDTAGSVITDSGSLKTQQFIFTNLTPDGMSAEILHEGRSDRYIFFAAINVYSQHLEEGFEIEEQIFKQDFVPCLATYFFQKGIRIKVVRRLTYRLATIHQCFLPLLLFTINQAELI